MCGGVPVIALLRGFRLCGWVYYYYYYQDHQRWCLRRRCARRSSRRHSNSKNKATIERKRRGGCGSMWRCGRGRCVGVCAAFGLLGFWLLTAHRSSLRFCRISCAACRVRILKNTKVIFFLMIIRARMLHPKISLASNFSLSRGGHRARARKKTPHHRSQITRP